MKPAIFLAPLLLLAACVPAEPPVVEEPPRDACGAPRYEVLIGQPATVLTDMTFPAGTRIIQPGSAVTMDFRPDRLNIEIGQNQRVEKVACY